MLEALRRFASAFGLLCALHVAACADSGTPSGDAGVDVDGQINGRDGGGRDAHSGVDGSDNSGLGALITPLPANLIGVPDGGTEVLYVRGDGLLMRSKPDGTQPTELGIKPTFGYGPNPNLWVWTDVDADNALGTLNLYRPGDARTSVIAAQAAVDLFGVDEDGRRALSLVHVMDTGSGATSTRTADFILVDDSGTQRLLRSGVAIGRWDRRTHRHVGPCTPLADFLNAPVAVYLGCPSLADKTRHAYLIDLTTGNTSTIAENVSAFLRVGTDKSYALLADAAGGFFGVGADGRIVHLPEQDRLDSLAFLDGKRFAYTTSNNELMIASWPSLMPVVAVPAGASRIERASEAGDRLVFRQTTSMLGLRDLYVVDTSTATAHTPVALDAMADGYPGDDVFSEDGQWVQWLEKADANFVADIVTIRADGSGQSKLLGTSGYIVQNTADPDRVMVMVGTRISETTHRLISSMATVSRSGSDRPTILADDVDPLSFQIFPAKDRIFYRISEGPNAGLWVRELK
ncbi:MAG: hypothetical protein U1E65_34775 [Myxococcota bacterium]